MLELEDLVDGYRRRMWLARLVYVPVVIGLLACQIANAYFKLVSLPLITFPVICGCLGLALIGFTVRQNMLMRRGVNEYFQRKYGVYNNVSPRDFFRG